MLAYFPKYFSNMRNLLFKQVSNNSQFANLHFEEHKKKKEQKNEKKEMEKKRNKRGTKKS